MTIPLDATADDMQSGRADDALFALEDDDVLVRCTDGAEGRVNRISPTHMRVLLELPDGAVARFDRQRTSFDLPAPLLRLLDRAARICVATGHHTHHLGRQGQQVEYSKADKKRLQAIADFAISALQDLNDWDRTFTVEAIHERAVEMQWMTRTADGEYTPAATTTPLRLDV